MTGWIEIVDAGMATTVQDLGRAGYAHLGVPGSGAVDPALMGVLNRLVGNPSSAATIETCGGLVIRALTALLVATSAEPAPTSLQPGQLCSVAAGSGGRLWQYVAVRGGIHVEQTLGSSSTDTLSGLGPAPSVAGDRLQIGDLAVGPIVADLAPVAAIDDVARITRGPRSDWFAPHWTSAVTRSRWIVTATSRVGVRLHGEPLIRVVTRELPSEGLVRGAVQVPPDGDPVMMLADHPTTGGYPVIAVVHPDDVAVVAQHAAGTSVRLRLVDAG
jgi:biotin-dependent carboxylase-like uncharacterized protein